MTQRRNYLPQKGAQGKFVLTLLLLIFLVAVITFCNLYVMGTFIVQNVSSIEASTLNDHLGMIWSTIGWRLVLLILVNVIVVAIIGIFYSHQFAGPSYKIEKSLREISQGDLSFKIILRTNDSMHNVAESLNQMIDNFRAVIAKAKELTSQSRESLEKIEASNEESEKAVLALRGIQGELEDLLAGFKLTRQGNDEE